MTDVMLNLLGTAHRSLASRALAIVVLLAGIGPAEAAGPPLRGDMTKFQMEQAPRAVPDVPFTDAEGAAQRLDGFKGRVLLVNFWATWCAPCVKEMPSLDRLAERLQDIPFRLIAISTDRGGARVVEPFLEKLGTRRIGIHLDTRMELTRALGIQGLPTTLLIDADGRIVGRLVGEARWDTGEAEALIRHYLVDPQQPPVIRAGG
jgi:thiol-disulfide isomerase/thioredoxin